MESSAYAEVDQQLALTPLVSKSDLLARRRFADSLRRLVNNAGGAANFLNLLLTEKIAASIATEQSSSDFVSGIFLFLLGVIGCFACMNENRCLLSTFFILLLLILLGEVTAATMGIIYHGQVQGAIDTELNKELQSYHNDSLLKSEVDFIQSTYQCCGVNNFTDWQETPWSRQHNQTVPDSCCRDHRCNDTDPAMDSRVFHHGCLSKLNNDFSRYLGLIAAFSLVVAILQALGLLASCVLMCRERQRPTYQRFGEQEGGRHV